MVDDVGSKMKYVRSFIKNSTVIPNKDEGTWELLGVCLGDGCLSRFYSNYDGYFKNNIRFTGNSDYDIEYYSKHLIPLLSSKFNIKINQHIRKDCNAVDILINNQKVFNFLKKLGMPVGKKKYNIRIPRHIYYCKMSEKAAILRGLLDTDGCIYARKDEGYRYPHIKITSSNTIFLFQLKGLIKEFGINAYVHIEGRSDGAGDVVVRGIKNISLWMAKIGTSHPFIKERYEEWLSKGILLPKNLHYNTGS